MYLRNFFLLYFLFNKIVFFAQVGRGGGYEYFKEMAVKNYEFFGDSYAIIETKEGKWGVGKLNNDKQYITIIPSVYDKIALLKDVPISKYLNNKLIFAKEDNQEFIYNMHGIDITLEYDLCVVSGNSLEYDDKLESLNRILTNTMSFKSVQIKGANGTILNELPIEDFINKLSFGEYGEYFYNEFLFRESLDSNIVVQYKKDFTKDDAITKDSITILKKLLSKENKGFPFLNREMDDISKQLAAQLKKNKIKRVGIADLVYKGQQNNELGIYLADELCLSLIANSDDLSVTNSKEIDSKKQETISDKLSRFETILGIIKKTTLSDKVDGIVFGDVVDQGDYLRITLKVVDRKTGITIGVVKDDIVKKSDIIMQFDKSLDYYITSSASIISSIPNTINYYKSQDLLFEVIGCRQAGKNIECKLEITSLKRDLTIGVEVNKKTRIIDANSGNEFFVSVITLANLSSTKGVSEFLAAGYPVKAIIKFPVDRLIKSIGRLEISYYLPDKNETFLAKFDNIIVKQE